MSSYYNENDPFCVAWLRELIKAGHIADGEVDDRSIELVRPDDLRGFDQCHFFAGIGGWSLALRIAGWPDDRPCWTGSCPCQPFSVAGKSEGVDDPRHLWPTWFRLISECRPATVFGEQTASKSGDYWIDLVLADMEGIDYAIGATDLPAACVGAPHRRQRLWFVADTDSDGIRQHARKLPSHEGAHEERAALGSDPSFASGAIGRVADNDDARRQTLAATRLHGDRESGDDPVRRGADDDMGDAYGRRRAAGHRNGDDQTTEDEAGAHGWLADTAGPSGAEHEHDARKRSRGGAQHTANGRGITRGYWDVVDWIPCIDGRARPVEPGAFPLAHGVPARVGRLRGYGNAINPYVAAALIEAYCEARGLIS